MSKASNGKLTLFWKMVSIALENLGQGHRNRQWQLTRVITAGWVTP